MSIRFFVKFGIFARKIWIFSLELAPIVNKLHGKIVIFCDLVSWFEVRLGRGHRVSMHLNLTRWYSTIKCHFDFWTRPKIWNSTLFSWNCSHSMGMCFSNIIFMNLKSAFQYPIQALSVLRREVTFHPIQLTIANSNKLISA